MLFINAHEKNLLLIFSDLFFKNHWKSAHVITLKSGPPSTLEFFTTVFSLLRMAEIALTEHLCNEEIKLLYMLVVKLPSSKLVKMKNAQAQKGITFTIMNVTQ